MFKQSVYLLTGAVAVVGTVFVALALFRLEIVELLLGLIIGLQTILMLVLIRKMRREVATLRHNLMRGRRIDRLEIVESLTSNLEGQLHEVARRLDSGHGLQSGLVGASGVAPLRGDSRTLQRESTYGAAALHRFFGLAGYSALQYLVRHAAIGNLHVIASQESVERLHAINPALIGSSTVLDPQNGLRQDLAVTAGAVLINIEDIRDLEPISSQYFHWLNSTVPIVAYSPRDSLDSEDFSRVSNYTNNIVMPSNFESGYVVCVRVFDVGAQAE